LGLALLAGCEAPEEVTPGVGLKAAVTFVYKAPTARNPAVPDCGVGPTHIHPSWRRYELVELFPDGPDQWTRSFTAVPVGERLRIRISDANYCDRDPNGASTENVFANGVQLTTVVPTPGNGTEPGLSLYVEADGTVRP
jgi:hypothetical protein